jgi:glycosyltransferase involved in cell wall biosynthesis
MDHLSANEGNEYISFSCVKDSVYVDYLLTIVITTYLHQETLCQAIDSAIFQENIESLYEILVISNSINTLSFINERYAHNTNLCAYENNTNIGASANHNRGAILAKGKYILFLHDDDLLLPTAIADWVKVLKRKSSNYYISNILIVQPGNKINRTSPLNNNQERFICTNYSNCITRNLSYFLSVPTPTAGCIVVEKMKFIEIGGMKTNSIIYDKELLILALTMRLTITKVNMVTGIHRMSAASTENTEHERVNDQTIELAERLIHNGEIAILVKKVLEFVIYYKKVNSSEMNSNIYRRIMKKVSVIVEKVIRSSLRIFNLQIGKFMVANNQISDLLSADLKNKYPFITRPNYVDNFVIGE